MTDEEQPHNRTVERILRSHSDADPAGGDAPGYVAARIAENFPQMGFSVLCANGDRHGFFFHNLDNLHLVATDHAEMLSFTHRGKAVTLRGQKLQGAFQGIMDHTLQELCEHRANHDPEPIPNAPMIDRIRVDDLTKTQSQK